MASHSFDGEARVSNPIRAVLIGNPNVGKTTLFNRLCGLRSHTANHPGSTVEEHRGRAWTDSGTPIDFIDLPGVYGLHLQSPESAVCLRVLEGEDEQAPDIVVIVADATNLARNLQFVASVLQRSTRAVVALNLCDEAARQGLILDTALLSERLRCPVIALSARTGQGCLQLSQAIETQSQGPFRVRTALLESDPPAGEPGDAALSAWASRTLQDVAGHSHKSDLTDDSFTERLDTAFTHPIGGLVVFAFVMTLFFASIFWLAQYPMEWIDALFAHLGGFMTQVIPPGMIADLLSQGVVGGIAGTVVFVPQICLLFFLLALLEDSGYLARASFAMDRLMRRFGLPGQSFIPLLSSHACALPGIMSTRLIPNTRDRLATILVAPFLSCSARVPVYVLVTSLLFADNPIAAGAAFVGAYALGAIAALFTAWIAGKTVLPGAPRPMMIELPPYRFPDWRVALHTAIDRGALFLKQAGSIILTICIVMWWLSAFPRAAETVEVTQLRHQSAALLAQAEQSTGVTELALRLESSAAQDDADAKQAGVQRSSSLAGQLGAFIEPVFRPLGFEREVVVAVMTSFLAREVFVSTLKVLIGAGDNAEVDEDTVTLVRSAKRVDGSPLLDRPSTVSLLVFYVLALQCLPTLAVVRRETGSWKWPAIQLGWMTAIAWILGAVAYFLMTWFESPARDVL
ncbi:MAG: ferrous iron transporter B [Planctomycetota bacterium]|nr:ferrous iron transporter B [Planctomycetota bacterium]